MSKIIKGGVDYGVIPSSIPVNRGGTGANSAVDARKNLGIEEHVELTKKQFNSLTEEEKNDGTVYFITDDEITDLEVTNSFKLGNVTLQPSGDGIKFIFDN